MTENRRRLTFLDRNKRRTPATVRTNTTLPPRDTFAGHTEALKAYDEYTKTKAARQLNYREARKLRDAATAGRTEYRQKVRAALTVGKPTDKITDPHDGLIVQAEALEALAQEADAHLIRLGLNLGEAIADVSADLFPASEASMEAAAERVRADITTLRESWAQWSGAWQVRRTLSNMHHFGGMLDNYDPDVKLPTEVANAIDLIEEHLDHLDLLRADEADLTAWRDEQDKADQHNRTSIGR